MRKKKKSNLGKLLVLAVLASTFMLLGDTYAAWTKEQKIDMHLNTGSFNMLFKEDGIYKTEIVRGDEVIDSNVSINPEFDDGKKVIINMDAAILSDLLMDDTYLRVSMPIVNEKKGYYERVLEYEPDFGKTDESLDMEVDKVFINYAGRSYEYADIDSVFTTALNFKLVRSVQREDDVLYCVIYLKLSDESRDVISDYPNIIELKIEDLESMPSTVIDSEQDGLLVLYKGELDFRLDQKEAKTVEE